MTCPKDDMATLVFHHQTMIISDGGKESEIYKIQGYITHSILFLMDK
jgi:hypothetical protein